MYIFKIKVSFKQETTFPAQNEAVAFFILMIQNKVTPKELFKLSDYSTFSKRKC